MIVVKLMGGLGNQMFQYAFGRCLSLLKNTPLLLDKTFLEDRSYKENFTYRDYELDIFPISPRWATPKQVHSFIQPSLIDKLAYFLSPREHVVESPLLHLSSFDSLSSNLYLEGFWQSEDFFLPVQEQIRKDFTFKTPLEGRNKELALEMAQCNSVSVHVRRGDYISNQTALQFHGVMSPEYYKQAGTIIESKVGGAIFFVFSDDPKWSKENIKLPGEVFYIEHNKQSQSYLDMQLMSLCKHHIIANSSFSWWGAWLNNSEEKIVVAPEKWFASSEADYSKKVPIKWQKI